MSSKVNFKVMKKPELTDEEIKTHMNFDKLLESYQQTGSVAGRPKWVTVSIYSFLTVATLAVIGYFYFRNTSPVETTPPEQHAAVDSTTKVNNEKSRVEKKENAEKAEEPARVKPIEAPVQKRVPEDSTVIQEKKSISQLTEAAPVDGYPSLYSYFDKELKYPGSPKDSIEGIVTVSFAINSEGKPDQIKIENSLGQAFDVECKRVIENMPLWKPATINGKPVRVRLSIPLTFKIKK